MNRLLYILMISVVVGCDSGSSGASNAPQIVGTWVSNCLPNGLLKTIAFTEDDFVIKNDIYSKSDCSGEPFIVTGLQGTYDMRYLSNAPNSELFEIDFNFKDGSFLYDMVSISDIDIRFGDTAGILDKETPDKRPTSVSLNEFYSKL